MGGDRALVSSEWREPTADLEDQHSPKQQLILLPATLVETNGEQPLTPAAGLLKVVQRGVDKFLEEARIKVKQHRAEFKVKKQRLRQRRLVEEADKTQEQDPVNISPFAALPHFKYLEIAEAVETELPSELTGFGSLHLSKNEAPQPVTAAAEQSSVMHAHDPYTADPPFESYAEADMSEEDVAGAAAGLLQRISLSPGENAHADTQMLDNTDKENLSLGPPAFTSYTEDLPPHQAYTSQRYSTEPYAPRDNLLCIFTTCPINEIHCEGPYYHNGELGDQNHPYFKGSNPPPFIWRAWEKRAGGTSTNYEDDIVGGFWAWHVPPFCYLPEKGSSESGNATLRDESMEIEKAG